MWLPTPIYERFPQFWFLLGILIILNSLYIGLDVGFSLVYVLVGFGCCVYGTAIAVLRMKSRHDSSEHSDNAATPE